MSPAVTRDKPAPSHFFFFNDTATTEIYTLSLHDALPISLLSNASFRDAPEVRRPGAEQFRSEEHTSELQSPCNLVCRLLLEKKQQGNTRRKSRRAAAGPGRRSDGRRGA